MNDHIREQLLGYLLDALDDTESQEVERCLAGSPQLQHELESLRASLRPLAALNEEFQPPDGLAGRTCEMVAEHGGFCRPVPAAPLPGVAPPSASWSLADLVVVAGVCAIAAMLFFPALANSRYVAQITRCQNNLRIIGLGLVDYSDKVGGGHFPQVPCRGNRAFAGVYAPILREYGYLTDPRVLLCPSSPHSDQLRVFRVPTLAEIDAANERCIASLRETAGGSYAYNLGVVVGGEHQAPRNQGRWAFAIMADTPPARFDAVPNVAIHAGRGYNVLYEDGHVCLEPLRGDRPTFDDPFRNRRGVVEAGVDENDAVVGRSEFPPFLWLHWARAGAATAP